MTSVILKHPLRTITVVTRLSATTMHATYLNALHDDPPYIVTVVTEQQPDPQPIGVDPENLPAIGETKVYVSEDA